MIGLGSDKNRNKENQKEGNHKKLAMEIIKKRATIKKVAMQSIKKRATIKKLAMESIKKRATIKNSNGKYQKEGNHKIHCK